MSNTIWAVDGSFFAQRVSGIQRYSIELLAALDRIVSPGFVEIVTPQGRDHPGLPEHPGRALRHPPGACLAAAGLP